jgi:hypothetical protein
MVPVPAQEATAPARAEPTREEEVASRAVEAPVRRALPEIGRDWIAQLGVYARLSRARIEAIDMRHLRGVGIARVARVESHGRTLWKAQLAGLTFSAAHETCDVLAARGRSCLIIPPATDHLAMLDSGDDN